MSSPTVLDPSPGRVTLASVAQEASVSMSTVSKVLNGRTGVSEETRLRVEELLHLHGYNRRGSAHASNVVELVFSELDTEWAIEIIRGVETVARERSMTISIMVSGDHLRPARDWIDGVLQRQPAGVILVFSDLSQENKRQLRTRKIPFAIIDPAGDPAPDVPSVGSANWSGGVQATEHLIRLGHRKIGIITGPEDMMCSRARLSGFRSAMEAAGIPVNEDHIRVGDFHRESGIRLGSELLSHPDRPTAIFAESDLQALGVYEAARSLGLDIPADLSIVGYDDLPLSGLVSPPLTTVRQPSSEMAEQATRLVLGYYEVARPENMRIDLATTLIVRESTRSLS